MENNYRDMHPKEESQILQDLLCLQLCGKTYSALTDPSTLPPIPREMAGSMEYDHQRSDVKDYARNHLKAKVFERLFEKQGADEIAKTWSEQAEQNLTRLADAITSATRSNPLPHQIKAYVQKVATHVAKYVDSEIGASEKHEVAGR